MELQSDVQWKHEPGYVRTPQSVVDGLIDKSIVWTPQKFDKFKEN